MKPALPARAVGVASALGHRLRRLSTSPGLEVLHRSRIPTFHFQDSLPKLPIPALEDTLANFLYAAEPVTSAAELAEARTLADEFLAGEGRELQEALKARDASKYSSYIAEPWFELYLRDRRSILLNYNPQLTFTDETGEGQGTQVGRAKRFVLSHAPTHAFPLTRTLAL